MDVAVLGAGRRGRGIAGRCAVAGHDVALYDEDANVVMDTVDEIERAHGSDAAARVSGTTGLEPAVTDASIVVVATEGSVAEKRDLLAGVEELVADDALIATSDVATSVTAVAAGLLYADRAVGLHFVDADVANSLVEIVVADQSAATTVERAEEFVSTLDCPRIVVGDGPGFATTRLDLALIVEATRMIETGVAGVEAVDRAMTVGRGNPQGPLELADSIGIDRVVARLEDLADRLDGRFDPPGILYEKIESGAIGRRTGEGFYVWEQGEPIEPAEPDPAVVTGDDGSTGIDR